MISFSMSGPDKISISLSIIYLEGKCRVSVSLAARADWGDIFSGYPFDSFFGARLG